MQRTTFPIEILVGEDESTDGTREICQRFAIEHGDRIRLFLNSRKDVLHINGLPTGRANVTRLMAAARGEYIALCEGDDYWTDPLKLQKQVEILSMHASMAGCAHGVQFIDERTNTTTGSPFKQIPEGPVNIEDIAPTRCYHTASLMFRRQALESSWWPQVSKAYLSGDKAIALALYHAGGIYFLPEQMAVYLRHVGGASTSKRSDLYMQSDIQMYRETSSRFTGHDRTYLMQCATYYRVKRAEFRLGRIPWPKAFMEHLGLLPYVGRSPFLSWSRYKKLMSIVISCAFVRFRSPKAAKATSHD